MFQLQLPAAMSSHDKLSVLQKKGFPIGREVKIGDDVEILGNELRIGDGTQISRGTKLVFDKLELGKGVFIGENCDIRSKHIILEDGVSIGYSLRALVADELSLGRNARLGHSSEIVCRRAIIGEGSYAEHHVTIGGGGGVLGPHSQVTIGRFVHIGEYTVLNTARELTIGDYAGLGAEVMVYTHGMWPPALEGYPVTFGPVTIGRNAWVPGKIIVLPNVTIGDGAVVGIGSLVNKDIPAYCLAAGMPAKILKENYYPRPLTLEDKDRIIKEIFDRYIPDLQYKGFEARRLEFGDGIALELEPGVILAYRSRIDAEVEPQLREWLQHRLILLYFECQLVADFFGDAHTITRFDISNYEVHGLTDAISEDVRDFFRRNCVRFYTTDKFRSIVPPAFKWLIDA